MTVTPRSSQRVAPFLVTPKIVVATSSASPRVYSGTASASSRCGGTCATTNRMPAAMSMLRPWSTKRVPWSKPTEYIVVMPIAARINTASASGASKPRKIGLIVRCQTLG